MQKRKQLLMLGGDERQIYLKQALEASGYTVHAWGLGSHDTGLDWKKFLQDSNAILLPMPATRDGVRIRCALMKEDPLRFSTLVDSLKPKTKIFGGKIPSSWQSMAEDKGMILQDLLDFEALQMRNALPTAEGAIALAMQALPCTIDGCEVAILGYGRIASLLAEKLSSLGANVTVFARKIRDLEHAKLRHLQTKSITIQDVFAGSKQYRVLFNTIPERILTEEKLCQFSKSCLLVELASFPGGFDPVSAEQNGFQVLSAQGLPGKLYPESAGNILAEIISNLLIDPV